MKKVKIFLPKNIKDHVNDNLEKDFDLTIYPYLLEKIIFSDPIKDCIYKWDKNLKKLIKSEKSLFFTEKSVWLPIWNYSSQFFVNIYLNDLDLYIKSLWFLHFRYVDDLVIFWNNFSELSNLEKKINNYLEINLNQTLAKQKTKLKPIKHWIDFLWYFVKPYCLYIRNRVKSSFIKKLKQLEKDFIIYKGDIKILLFENIWNITFICGSYFWHMWHANTKNMLKKIIYKNNFLRYIYDFDWSLKYYLKSRKYKNLNEIYNFYDKIFKNTILFFPRSEYFIFKSKYFYIKDFLWFEPIFYKNNSFKIKQENYRILAFNLVKNLKKTIIILKEENEKYSIKSILIHKKEKNFNLKNNKLWKK